MKSIKYIYLIIIVSLLLFGCRDYITGIGENEPPVLYSGKTLYTTSDSITVYLQNKSLSSIYVIGAFDYVEKNSPEGWTTYEHITCTEGCPEFSVSTRQIISNEVHVNDAGTYRFVCLYSFTAGAPNEDKIKLYSNEFTVQ